MSTATSHPMAATIPGARSFDEIVQLIRQMQASEGPSKQMMQAVLDRYEGEYVIPMPQLPDERKMPLTTPMLVGEAVDWLSSRAASVQPVVSCAVLKPNIASSRAKGMRRRKIIAATYDQSKWGLGRRRMYKQLTAYATTSIKVLPDFDKRLPRIQVSSPLATYSEPQAAEENRPPLYVAYIVRKSGDSLRYEYPFLRAEQGGPITSVNTDQMWDTFEWMDCEQIVFGLLGPAFENGLHMNFRYAASSAIGPAMPLDAPYPNRTGIVNAVVPHNISLGAAVSRIAAMLGMVDLMAKLTALDIAAQEKAIFPDMYVVGREGARPTIINGAWADGREGVMNLLQDVDSIGTMRTTPDQRTTQITDRMERNFRNGSGLVPQAGGETYGALRTGRGIDALAGMAIDPRIQELHEISQAWLPHMNEVILRMYEAYWPNRQFSMYSGWSGDIELVEFVPKDDIESCFANAVSYTIPGADIVQQTQILGSLYGTKAISLRTFRDRHPWIQDPEHEGAIVDEEEFAQALKQSLLQQLIAGQLPLTVATAIRKHMQAGDDIFDAVNKADEEAKRLQATEAPPAPAGMVGAPEAQPGLAAGPGAFQQPEMAPRVQPQADVARMRQLIQSFQQTGA